MGTDLNFSENPLLSGLWKVGEGANSIEIPLAGERAQQTGDLGRTSPETAFELLRQSPEEARSSGANARRPV